LTAPQLTAFQIQQQLDLARPEAIAAKGSAYQFLQEAGELG